MSNTRSGASTYGAADMSLSEEERREMIPLYPSVKPAKSSKSSRKSVAMPRTDPTMATAQNAVTATLAPVAETFSTVADNAMSMLASAGSNLMGALYSSGIWANNKPQKEHPRQFMNHVFALHPVLRQLYFILGQQTITPPMEDAFLKMVKMTLTKAEDEAKENAEHKKEKLVFTEPLKREMITAIRIAKDRFTPASQLLLIDYEDDFERLQGTPNPISAVKLTG